MTAKRTVPPRNAKRIVHDGTNQQGRDGGRGDEHGNQDPRQQPGDDQRPRRKTGEDQPPIGEMCLAGLEEHGEGGQKRGGPPGGRGLYSVAGAAQQLGGIRHRLRGNQHEDHGDQHQHEQVHRIANVLDEKPAGQDRDGGHFCVAFPS